MPPSTQDLVGKTYGRLTALRFLGILPVSTLPKWEKKRAAFWECECACGNRVRVRANQLKRGDVKSCGCLQQEHRTEGLSEIGKQNALSDGIAAANYVYGRYKYSAKKRGIEFWLSFEQAMTLFKGMCHYCGDLPSQVARTGYPHGDFVYSGIDRVDNEQGYLLKNCVSCCGRCNYAKHEDTPEQFKAWLKRAYEYNFKP